MRTTANRPFTYLQQLPLPLHFRLAELTCRSGLWRSHYQRSGESFGVRVLSVHTTVRIRFSHAHQTELLRQLAAPPPTGAHLLMSQLCHKRTDRSTATWEHQPLGLPCFRTCDHSYVSTSLLAVSQFEHTTGQTRLQILIISSTFTTTPTQHNQWNTVLSDIHFSSHLVGHTPLFA